MKTLTQQLLLPEKKALLMMAVAAMMLIFAPAGTTFAQTKQRIPTLSKPKEEPKKEETLKKDDLKTTNTQQESVKTPSATTVGAVVNQPSKIVDPATLSLRYDPKANPSIADGKKLTCTLGGEGKVTWKSQNTAVATVDASGNVMAKGYGITTIVATTEKGTTGICDVTVYKPLDKSHLGEGINIFEAETFAYEYIKYQNPVYDRNKFNIENPGKIEQNWTIANTVDLKVSSGKSMSEITKSLNNQSNVSYAGAFSASVDVKYSSSKTETKTYMFSKGRGSAVVMEEYIKDYKASSFQKYLNPSFIDAVNKVSTVADAKSLLKKYGTHVIISCGWGGVLDVDVLYNSSQISSESDLSVTVKASYVGLSASNKTNLSTKETNFLENSESNVKFRGGSAFAATQLGDITASKYQSWINSINARTNIIACRISGPELIPLTDIVKDKFGASSKQYTTIQNAYNDLESNAISMLAAANAGTPMITALDVRGQGGSNMKVIPAPNTDVVHNNFFDRNSSTLEYLDFNKGSKGEYINLFYTVAPVINCTKGITDIVMIEGKNATAPSGYIKVQYDLNAGCGGDSHYLYLAYKKATKNDRYVIDFIGGGSTGGSNLPSLPPADSNGQWNWVYKYNTNNIADFNEGAKGDFIRLVVHKVTNPQYGK